MGTTQVCYCCTRGDSGEIFYLYDVWRKLPNQKKKNLAVRSRGKGIFLEIGKNVSSSPTRMARFYALVDLGEKIGADVEREVLAWAEIPVLMEYLTVIYE